MFSVVYGFDYVLVVAREIEKASALPRRPEFGENVFTCKRHEIVGGIKVESGPKMSKNPRGVILEFEIVFCRWCQLIASAGNHQ